VICGWRSLGSPTKEATVTVPSLSTVARMRGGSPRLGQ
jgi:hypothetical protein